MFTICSLCFLLHVDILYTGCGVYQQVYQQQLLVAMALTAGALKGKVDMSCKKNACLEWVNSSYGGDVYGKQCVSQKLNKKQASVSTEHTLLLIERDQLQKELNDLRIRSRLTEERLTKDYNALLKEVESLLKVSDELRNENNVLKQENVKLRSAIPHQSVVEESIKKVIVAENMVVATAFQQPRTKSNSRKHKPKQPQTPRVYDVNKEEDIEYIVGQCGGRGVGKCMLSEDYVNQHYQHIVRNNGFHNGVANTCLALSLSDGLSRILNGRPANNQEKDEMIKVLGCKGKMMDMSDLHVLVAIFNKVCAPHAINVHVFERKANGYHKHYQSIAHSPNASTRDKCIVLSWVAHAHFELMVKS